jgi:hypothetical protein
MDSELNFENTHNQIQKIMTLDLSSETSRDQNNNWILATLEQALKEISAIQGQATIGSVRSAGAWMAGNDYANLAQALTLHFATSGWLLHEMNASGLWAKATLAVNAHYRHLVGPAMLAYASCKQRRGEIDEALESYAAVIRDFVCELEDWMPENNVPENSAPEAEDRISLESLQTAVEQSLALGTGSVDEHDLKTLEANVKAILNRPVNQS